MSKKTMMHSQHHHPQHIEKDVIRTCYLFFNNSQTRTTKVVGSIRNKYILSAIMMCGQTVLLMISAFLSESRFLIPIFLIAASLLLLLSLFLGLMSMLYNFLIIPMGYAVFVFLPRFEGQPLPPAAFLIVPLLSFLLGILFLNRRLRWIAISYSTAGLSKNTGLSRAANFALIGSLLGLATSRLFPDFMPYKFALFAIVLLFITSFTATLQLYRAYLIKKYCPYLVTLADARYTNIDEVLKKMGRLGMLW